MASLTRPIKNANDKISNTKVTQHPCHGSKKWRHCKHGKYATLLPVETTNAELMKNLRATGDIKDFLRNSIIESEVYYEELCDEDKAVADQAWADHRADCDECYDNPCL